MTTAEFYTEHGPDPNDPHAMNMWMQANNHHHPHHPLAYQPVGGGPHPHHPHHPHHYMHHPGMPMQMGPPPPMMMMGPPPPHHQHHPQQHSPTNNQSPQQQQQQDGAPPPSMQPPPQLPPLNENELDGMAYSLGWTKLETPAQPPMASYGREQPDGVLMRLNFWLNTSAVGSYVDHPNQNNNNSNNSSNHHKKGTQLFRRNNISLPEAYAIFENPRLHAGQPRGGGYYQQQQQHHPRYPNQHQHHQQNHNNHNHHNHNQTSNSKHPRQRRPCRYGVHCHNTICRFQHPPGFTPQPKQQQQQQGDKSSMQPTKQSSPKRMGGGGNGGGRGPCRYGARCTRPDCWFQHPTNMNSNNTTSVVVVKKDGDGSSGSSSTNTTVTNTTDVSNITDGSVTGEEKKELEV